MIAFTSEILGIFYCGDVPACHPPRLLPMTCMLFGIVSSVMLFLVKRLARYLTRGQGWHLSTFTQMRLPSRLAYSRPKTAADSSSQRSDTFPIRARPYHMTAQNPGAISLALTPSKQDYFSALCLTKVYFMARPLAKNNPPRRT